ncbi:MAG: adenosine deaminase [Kofleriaceae bacterium]
MRSKSPKSSARATAARPKKKTTARAKPAAAARARGRATAKPAAAKPARGASAKKAATATTKTKQKQAAAPKKQAAAPKKQAAAPKARTARAPRVPAQPTKAARPAAPAHRAPAPAPRAALDPRLAELIRRLLKVELHLHIEGTLEPELAFALAARHGVALPYGSVEELRAAYAFDDLQSFLDLYYATCAVLRDRSDFYTLAMAYFARAHADNIVHAELFFDPQTHTSRGVPIGEVIGGLRDAMSDAERRYGITSELILCFLRHLSEDAALATLESAIPYRSELAGVGLDSGERGNPPEKFVHVFARAKSLGFRLVAHAGEEGPAAYIRDALDLLQVERIDHGVRCEEDPALVERLIRDRTPLTVCPLSNVKLRVFDKLADHNLARLLERGVNITIHSDDPAYFGGYLGENFRACAAELGLGARQLTELCENAIRAAFIPATEKASHLARLRRAVAQWTMRAIL